MRANLRLAVRRAARASGTAALLLPALCAAQSGGQLAYGEASFGERVYLGAAGGFAFHDLSCPRYVDCDRNAVAARGALGIAVQPGLAVEGLVLSFGKTRSREAGFEIANSVLLGGVAAVALVEYGGGIVGKARLGLGGVRTHTQRRAIGSNAAASGSGVSWQPAVYAGFSLGLAVTRNLLIELHYDATSADYVYREGRADALTAGLSLRF